MSTAHGAPTRKDVATLGNQQVLEWCVRLRTYAAIHGLTSFARSASIMYATARIPTSSSHPTVKYDETCRPGSAFMISRAAADQVLLRDCRSGGEAAFSAFYERFAPVLYSLACAMLDDEPTAEDALQDAFVHIWKNAAAYDPQRGSVFTWTVMIVRSKALERLRSAKGARPSVGAAADEAAHTAKGIVAQGRKRERVGASLAQLPVAERAAINLAFFAGFTPEEIAQELGMPRAEIGALIHRGLLALRETTVTL